MMKPRSFKPTQEEDQLLEASLAKLHLNSFTEWCRYHLTLSALSTQAEGQGCPATPSPHTNCIFNYWRKDKDGNYNNICMPRVEDPSLIEDRLTLLKFCKMCDMKQKALIRYKQYIEKSPHTLEKQTEYELEHRTTTKQCSACKYYFFTDRIRCPNCGSEKIEVVSYGES